MYNLILAFHVLIALALIAVILVQRGRSGGLIEALGGVESIFGTKTSSFFVKATVVLAVLFFLASISLAYLSKEQGKSLMTKYGANESASTPMSMPAPTPAQPTQSAPAPAVPSQTPAQ